MKNLKLMKTVLLLFAIVAFSSCEDDGQIQFVVVDEFETEAKIVGLATQTGFTVTNTTDISELIDNSASFVEAEIEKVTVTLQDDFSGASIPLNLNVSVGGVPVLNQLFTLNKGVGVEVDLSTAANILGTISSGTFPFEVTGTSTSALGDNDFTLKLVFKLKAIVE